MCVCAVRAGALLLLFIGGVAGQSVLVVVAVACASLIAIASGTIALLFLITSASGCGRTVVLGGWCDMHDKNYDAATCTDDDADGARRMVVCARQMSETARGRWGAATPQMAAVLSSNGLAVFGVAPLFN